MHSLLKRARRGALVPMLAARAGTSRPRWLPAAVVTGGLVLVFALGAAPAGAKIVRDTSIHRNFGVVPTVFQRPKPQVAACNAENSDCGLLNFHGSAGVQAVQHAQKVYLLFWTPTGHGVPYPYKAGMASWVSDLAHYNASGGGPISVTQQYYDTTGPSNAKNFVSYAITNGGALTDTDAYPASGCPAYTDAAICLTDAQIQTEVANYVNAHSLPTGLGVQYYVMTPFNVGSCFDSGGTSCAYTDYCGYHGNFTNSSHTILYADMPWAYNVTGCDVNLAFGTGYANGDALDPVVGVFSHELAETMTDPVVNPSATGWWQNSGTDAGMEIGDKCAYIYGSGGFGSLTGVPTNGLGNYNYTLNNSQYLLQLEFSNANANCIVHNTDIQPSFTVSPTTAHANQSQTFTATVTDANQVAYIDWTFGDGSSTRTFSCSGAGPFTCTVAHTYAATGTKSMQVVVTDKHGDQKIATPKITVS